SHVLTFRPLDHRTSLPTSSSRSVWSSPPLLLYFFSNDPPPTEIYTLSLHDALPISRWRDGRLWFSDFQAHAVKSVSLAGDLCTRSEEHTSELQSRGHLVCRLLLEKKKNSSCEPRRTSERLA